MYILDGDVCVIDYTPLSWCVDPIAMDIISVDYDRVYLWLVLKCGLFCYLRAFHGVSIK